jgi:hypothetical protein
MSFWAYAVDHERFEPRRRGGGPELKRQLARASIAATRAVRSLDPDALFVSAEPLIHVASVSTRKRDVAAAAKHNLSQFEALDMLTGRERSEFGGASDLLDAIGVNFYPDNQWYADGHTIPLGHHAYKPLRELLNEVYQRYDRPLFISETGAEGSARAAWLHYVASEVAAARASGVPIDGICIYPIVDYPGWSNDRQCRVGLFSSPGPDGRREVDVEFALEVERQRMIYERANSFRFESVQVVA